MKKKKTVLGLKLEAPKKNTPGAIGWAVIEENANNNVEYDKIENITENEVINQARKVVGDYFKNLRESKGLSYYAVSKSSGLATAQIQSIEDGETSYTIDSFLRICRGLDCYFLLKDREGKHLDENDMIDKI